MRTTYYLPLIIAAKCFLLLLFITTLDLRPIVADHIAMNSVDTLRYIRSRRQSARKLCGRVLGGKFGFHCTGVWLCSSSGLFTEITQDMRDTKFEKYTQYMRFRVGSFQGGSL